MKIKNIVVVCLSILFLVSVGFMNFLQAENYLQAFPTADKGMTRHVVQLPSAKNENLLKLQISVGKTMEVDSVNLHLLSGKIETKKLEGWGLNYYYVKDLGEVTSTYVGTLSARTVKKFVGLGQEFIIVYNSKVPVVIYTPKDAEVRYRIWQTKAKWKALR